MHDDLDPVARWGDAVRARLVDARLSAAGQTSIVEEFAQHLDDRYRALVISGVDESEARRLALAELESDALARTLVEPVSVRSAPTPPDGVGGWPSRLAGDARYAVRVLLRERAFTAVAVLTLALGIGATTAMFSLVHALLLRSLPYPEAERLATVVGPGMITPENLPQWRAGVPSMERLAAFGLSQGVLAEEGQARPVTITVADDELLSLLGARPVRGRLWGGAESSAGDAPIALVGERLWEEVLGGGEPAGRAIVVDGIAHEVVGVLPTDFHNLGYSSDVWMPLAQRPSPNLMAVVRLRPDVTAAEAEAELRVVAERVEASPLAETFGRSVRVNTLREVFTGESRTPLLVLFGAAAFVLMLACANLANLLLSRAAGRGREMTIRSALGAGRRALVQQLVVEHVVLGLAGAAVGLLLAWAAVHGIVALLPPHYGRLPLDTVRIDAVVLTMTLITAILTTLIAGLAPALVGLRTVARVSAMTRVTPTRSTRVWREALITAEVALALLLLIGTTLLVKTYLTLRPASPGYETQDRLTAHVTLHTDAARNIELVRRLTREIELAAPGVRAAAALFIPLSGMSGGGRIVAVDGEPVVVASGQRPPMLDVNPATPGYLDVLGTRVLQGRNLAERDVSGTPPVLVVNQAAAAHFWPDAGSPIGRRIAVELFGVSTDFVIVGVMENMRTSGIHTTSRPQGVAAFAQVPSPGVHVVVHTPVGSRFDAAELRRVAAAVDPAVVVGDVTTLAAIAARAVATPRYQMALMSGFAVLALLLAMIGCYGVLAYSVTERTREFGIRVALGAERRLILRAVMGRAALLVTAGLGGGILLAVASTRVLQASLYGIEPTDRVTFIGATLALFVVSMAAAYLPARRAAGVDPAIAIREE